MRKLCFFGIYVICHQFCFMSETQVLMAVSDFLDFFSRNHFLEGASFVSVGGFVFQLRGASFLIGGNGGGGGGHGGHWFS